jgi:hypothetical protein
MAMEFTIPLRIKNFIFDLHQATRVALRADEVQDLYEREFKDITEKLFEKKPWPEPESFINECRNDEAFLVFYRLLSNLY